MVFSRFFALDGAQLGLLISIPVIFYLLSARKNTSSTKPTGHRLKTALPFFGDTLTLLANVPRIHEWIYEFSREFRGEPVLVKAWGRPDLIFLCSPEHFAECLKLQFDDFPKGPFQCENLKIILGDGIFAVDHAKWVHQRKTASNLFTARSLREGMATVVRKHTATLCSIFRAANEHGRHVDLFKLFNRLTIEAIAEIGFGIEMNCLEADEEHPFQMAFDNAQRAISLRFVRPAPFWKLQRLLGVGWEGCLQRDMTTIDETVLGIISKCLERRQSHTREANASTMGESKDIVSLFLDNFENSPDSEGKAFDPKYLRDIVVNFLIAGRDTTAQALSWFFVNISKNPRVVARIRAELREQLPDLFDGSLTTPSLEQVSRLTYLEAALKETLRLHPSVPALTKHVQSDTVLSDGTFIREGSNITLSPWALGRMTHVWGEDAAEFKPERFIDEATGHAIHYPPHKFVAFNSGPRMCLGVNLAMMEMKIVSASLLSQFDIEVVSEHVTYDFSVTLPIRGELLARVTPAKPSPRR